MTSEQKLQNAKFEVLALDRVVRSLFLELRTPRLKNALLNREPRSVAQNISGVLMSVCCAVKLSVFGQIVLGKAKTSRRQKRSNSSCSLTPSTSPRNNSPNTSPRIHRVSRRLLHEEFLILPLGRSTRWYHRPLSGGSSFRNHTSLVLFCTEIVGLYFLSSVLLVREQL